MTTPTPATRRQGGTGTERGSATVQTLLWAPWLFLLALGGVQAAAYGWGYLVARHAADAAVQATRVQGGTPAAGQAHAEQVIAQAAGNSLTDPQVTVTRGGRETSVTVTGTVMRVVPLLPLPVVTVTASAPTEQFRPFSGDPP